MKKTSLTVLLTAMAVVAVAQGYNLQFNQAKLVSSSETVPAGKVWKIEGALLSLANGIRIPPKFIINQDTIVMGYDSYSSTILENVTAIQLEYISNTSYLPITSVGVFITGVGSGSSLINTTIAFPNITSSASSYTSLGTIAVPSPGDNVISTYSIRYTPQVNNTGCGGGYWSAGHVDEFRITFIKSNGQNVVAYWDSFAGSGGYCCYTTGSAPTQTQTQANQSATAETRTRPDITTDFPVWLPAGAILKTYKNISKLNVIEFNLVP